MTRFSMHLTRFCQTYVYFQNVFLFSVNADGLIFLKRFLGLHTVKLVEQIRITYASHIHLEVVRVYTDAVPRLLCPSS